MSSIIEVISLSITNINNTGGINNISSIINISSSVLVFLVLPGISTDVNM